MYVEQFFVKGIAHSSYLLGGTESCAIVDPRRDTEIYIKAAKVMGMKITHILETHLHADFISGHMDLARKTGAKIYAPKSAGCKFDHEPMSEGDSFKIDNLEIKVLETPGHTPEHISYVVSDKDRGDEPVSVFCGDTLFVGDVGRPDLFPGIAKDLAEKLYHSLHDKLMKLPDFCEVFPAHGAGSLCGRAMGAKRRSTIGYEKRYNAALQIKDKEEFIKSLTTDMPPAPDHFSRCSAINGSGPAYVSDLPNPAPLTPDEFKKKMDQENTLVLDLRNYDAFGGQHIPGSYHIGIMGNFATFSGWILPPDKKILLIPEFNSQALEAAIWLRRVGLDHSIGYLAGGMTSWVKAGLPTSHVCQISLDDFHELTQGEKKIIILDVRSPNEFMGAHIAGAVNIPVPDLRTKAGNLDKEHTIYVMCSTGNRSSTGTSLLKQQGYHNLRNVPGGLTGYTAAGYIPECPICFIPHGPHFLGKDQKLKMED